ncbi:unnamed protein product [Ambrosiozyma monospora]|uniref:Unnamed protein product n=1 Tax=Ambrosiozyma monospora TaxID=43982 RepID=A0ACB5SZX4_AMBMO|nr:unnamed protein product [Ambrosiozyma monospora]
MNHLDKFPSQQQKLQVIYRNTRRVLKYINHYPYFKRLLSDHIKLLFLSDYNVRRNVVLQGLISNSSPLKPISDSEIVERALNSLNFLHNAACSGNLNKSQTELEQSTNSSSVEKPLSSHSQFTSNLSPGGPTTSNNQKRKNHKKHNSPEIPEYRLIDAILKFESSKSSAMVDKRFKLPSNSLRRAEDVMLERKTHNFYEITSEERQAHQFYKLDTCKYYSYVNDIERILVNQNKKKSENEKNKKTGFDVMSVDCLFPVVQFERNLIFVNEELRVIL